MGNPRTFTEFELAIGALKVLWYFTIIYNLTMMAMELICSPIAHLSLAGAYLTSALVLELYGHPLPGFVGSHYLLYAAAFFMPVSLTPVLYAEKFAPISLGISLSKLLVLDQPKDDNSTRLNCCA